MMPDRSSCLAKPGPFPDVVTVVDDDPALLSALTLSLEVDGYVVHAFPTGEALLADAQFPIQGALIIDYRLPGMDGLELLGRLRARGVTAPALLMTTPNGPVLRKAAAANVRLLAKPLAPDTVSDAVRHLWEGDGDSRGDRPG